jgi:hypothetical protein
MKVIIIIVSFNNLGISSEAEHWDGVTGVLTQCVKMCEERNELKKEMS